MKIVGYGVLLGVALGVSNASAGVVKVEDYNSSIAPGFNCLAQNLSPTNTGNCVQVGECWRCSSSILCDTNNYPYTESNCVDPYEPGGDSCSVSGVLRYKLCNCKSNYTVCTGDYVGSGTQCVQNGNTLYSECLCDLGVFSWDSLTCTHLAGRSCTDRLGEHWNGCDDINMDQCEGFNYFCNDSGQFGIGEVCDGKYRSCGCDSTLYPWNENTCGNLRTLSGNTCHAINPNVDWWSSCVCPGIYNRSCSNTCVLFEGTDTTPPTYKTASECGQFAGCGDPGYVRYRHCGTQISTDTSLSCSTGKTVYRLNDSSNSVYANWVGHGMASGEWSDYPAFVCSYSTTDTISIYCESGICIEETASKKYVNGHPENTPSIPEEDFTYEKAGIMLNDTIAVAIDRDPKVTATGSLIKTYLSRWIGYSGGDNGSYSNYMIGEGVLNISYNSNTLCYGETSCSGVTNILHGLSNGVSSTALSGTATTSSSPRGPIDTYNYTFGVPYYNNIGNVITGSGENNSTYLGSLANGPTGEGKGIVAPAWYCMRKNLELMNADGFVIADNNSANAAVERGFDATLGNKVYYYLPTAGDLQIFNSYVNSHAGFISNTLEFDDNNPSISLWSSTLDGSTNTPRVYTYDLRDRSISAIGGEYDGSNNDGPKGTMCFIYVPGWTPSSVCTVEKNGYNVTLSGSGCVAQGGN